MKGNTSVGNVFKNRSFIEQKLESVSSAKNIDGQTNQGFVNTSKSSNGSAFVTSRKKGYIKGC